MLTLSVLLSNEVLSVSVGEDATLGDVLREAVRQQTHLDIDHLRIDAGYDGDRQPPPQETPLRDLYHSDIVFVVRPTDRAAAQQKLFEKGIHEGGYTEVLYGAARSGDVDMVMTVVDAEGLGTVPAGCFVAAAAMGHVEVVKWLLEETDVQVDDMACGFTALQRATAGNHTEVMCVLREHGANQNIADSSGAHLVHFAGKHGGVEALSTLRSWKANLAQVDKQNRTALHYAATYGRSAFISALLTALKEDTLSYPDVLRIRCVSGRHHSRTALHEACTGKKARLVTSDEESCTPMLQAQVECVKVLLSHGADPLAEDYEGRNSLLIAAHELSVLKMRYLWQSGASLDSVDPAGKGAVHIAAVRRDVAMLGFLQEGGADPTLADATGMTPLGCIVSQPQQSEALEASSVFMKSWFTSLHPPEPALTSAMNLPNRTLFHVAAEHGSAAGLCFLFSWCFEVVGQKGVEAYLKQRDSSGRQPLLLACSSPTPGTILQLLEWGADPNCSNVQGRTPLHFAASLCRVDLCRALVTLWGAGVERANEAGETALFDAVRSGCADTVSAMIDCGADVFACNVAGETPLHTCAGYRQIAVLQALRAKGAIVDAKDAVGRTPLHKAVELNDVPSAALLVRWGAQVDIQDATKETPLTIAKRVGQTSMLALLERFL